MAKVAIDVQTLQTAEKDRGIGRFVVGQIRALSEISTLHKMVFVGTKSLPEPTLPVPSREYHGLSLGGNNPTDHGTDGPIISKWLRDNEIDCYYATSPLMPDIAIPENRTGTTIVSMVHDLIPLLFESKAFPDRNNTTRNDYYRRLGFVSASDRIVTYSESNRRDLLEELSIPTDRTVVIGAGLDPRFRPVDEQSELDRVRKRFGITGRLILSVTGFNFRKNIFGTIQAFALLPKSLRENVSLALACSLSAGERAEVERTASRLGVSNQVILPGHVDEDLPVLYSLAEVFFMPTLYEGFGFPALESMACGTPVVVSGTSSLPEVVADAGLLVDPENPTQGAEALSKILQDPALRQELSRRGIARAKEFTWRKTAEKMLQTIETALERDTVILNNQRHKKEPLAVFSPQPPARSGIADYALLLTESLSRYCRPVCYSGDPRKPDGDFRGETRAIYHLGNSRLNEFVFKTALKHPGVLVLHDWSIHGMVYHSTVKQGDPDTYMDLMRTTYGERGERHAKDVIAGKTTIDFLTFPLSEEVIRRSLGVVVHSSWILDRVISVNDHPPVRVIRHGADIFEGPVGTPEERESFGIPRGSFVILSFGRVTRHKRVDILLRAAKVLSKRYSDILLVVAGEMDAEAREFICPLFERSGLGDHLLVLDHVPESGITPLLRSADVCVNLRFPTMGETSGSVIRSLGVGRPVIATDAGAFRELPDECVWKVQVSGKEEDLLCAYLERLYRDTELRARMGENALEWVRKNCLWGKVAREYMEFVDFCYSRMGDRTRE